MNRYKIHFMMIYLRDLFFSLKIFVVNTECPIVAKDWFLWYDLKL